MKKTFNGSPSELINDTEAIHQFLKGFSQNERLKLCCFCIMENIGERHDLRNTYKVRKDVFEDISDMLVIIEKNLITSYNKTIKRK